MLVLATLLAIAALVAVASFGTLSGDAAPLDPAVPIDVNTADAATLQLLPGVGPTLAQRIITERQSRGPFRDLDDLQRVKGIAEKLAARMAPHVRFDEVEANHRGTETQRSEEKNIH